MSIMGNTAKLSLSERIAWVKIHRSLTANDWSRKAGFRHNYLSVTVKRCEEEGCDLPARAASALARVARVSEEWLRTGRGKPEDGIAHDDAPPDSRGETATVGTVALELAQTARTAQGATTATDKVGGGTGSGPGSEK